MAQMLNQLLIPCGLCNRTHTAYDFYSREYKKRFLRLRLFGFHSSAVPAPTQHQFDNFALELLSATNGEVDVRGNLIASEYAFGRTYLNPDNFLKKKLRRFGLSWHQLHPSYLRDDDAIYFFHFLLDQSAVDTFLEESAYRMIPPMAVLPNTFPMDVDDEKENDNVDDEKEGELHHQFLMEPQIIDSELHHQFSMEPQIINSELLEWYAVFTVANNDLDISVWNEFIERIGNLESYGPNDFKVFLKRWQLKRQTYGTTDESLWQWTLDTIEQALTIVDSEVNN